MSSSRIFVVSCLLATVVPFLPESSAPGTTVPFPGWPARLQGNQLASLPLTARDKSFEGVFPGRVARFSSPGGTFVVRWVTNGTRKLHPAADCFKGLGYRVTPRPLWVDETGRRWGCFRAEREGETRFVYECVWDEKGRAFSDVSSWYWAVLLGRTRGPWWAVTYSLPEAYSSSTST